VSPVSLIIETDIFSDVDDVGALAVAHAHADAGHATLLGVGVNTPSRWGVAMAALINRHYGRPEVPVGAMLPLDDSVADPDYARGTVRAFGIDDPVGAEGAPQLLRRLLESAEDASVTVVSLGFFQNLVALLDEEPPGALPGADLVRRKVARTVVMGGLFPSGTEFNVAEFPATARAFAQRWPGRIEFLGWEVGNDVITGVERSRVPEAADPVAEAYRRFSGPGAGRKSWDLMTVDLAVRGAADHYRYSEPGRVEIDDDGATTWHASPDGPHRYVIRVASAETIAAHLDGLLARTPVGRPLKVGA
jgi:inosine-uridine nucleoside N-ribohydrolase